MARRTKDKWGEDRRSGGGSKLQRSETVTVRLDPKLRYLAELASRIQRRTLSSFVEWAVEHSLSSVFLNDGEHPKSLSEMTGMLWDTHEGERLCRMAIISPSLLNYDEQELWKFILESQILSMAMPGVTGNKWDWNWEALEQDQFPHLREQWDELKEAFESEDYSRRAWLKKAKEEFGSPI